MRIALFSETLPPQRNGVALILKRLTGFLTEQGHDVFVAGPKLPDDPWGPGGFDQTPESMTLERATGPRLPKYPDLTMARPFAGNVLAEVERFKPDVIHLVTEYTMGLTGLRAAKRLRTPVVASFHTNIPHYLPYYGFGFLSGMCWRYLKWFHNKAQFTLSPSEATRQILLERGFRDVRIWGRGVDTERFSPKLRDADVRSRNGSDDSLHVLYVGRLTPEKDLPVLFDAYRKLTAGNPPLPVNLVLTGDGAYTSKMRSKAPKDAVFTGYLSGEELAKAYASADVFVFPSRTDTLGNVVLEAQASGLPVIAAAEGGPVENIKDGENGFLCTPGDPASFAAKIALLAENPALRQDMAARAREWAERRTWDSAFATLIEGYEEAIRTHTP